VPIPATLHDSLMARLDRQAHLKEVIQAPRLSAVSFPIDCCPPSWELMFLEFERAVGEADKKRASLSRGHITPMPYLPSSTR